jgi:hypothetical protein
MKKSELRSLLKPLIKECINEVLLEDGILSKVVSEVIVGMSPQPLTESIQPTAAPVSLPKQNKALAEQKRKLMSALNQDAYNGVNLFEDTEPLSVYESRAPTSSGPDLGDSRDAGIDISSLVGGASKLWKAMK